MVARIERGPVSATASFPEAVCLLPVGSHRILVDDGVSVTRIGLSVQADRLQVPTLEPLYMVNM